MFRQSFTRWLIAFACSCTFAWSSASSSHPLAAWAPPQAAHALIAHAGEGQTVEGGETVTLDATYSWDAAGHALTCAWTQTEGPAAALELTDPCRPTFAAPTPGASSIAAENQVLAFELTISDGTSSAVDHVRVMVLKPFDAAGDAPAVVRTTGLGGSPGTLYYALNWANSHPGSRVTFDLPVSDPNYNATGGFWQFPHSGAGSIPPLLSARGVTIDGFSQHVNSASRGEFANPDGPAILIPGVILEFGHYFTGAGIAERTIARGLAQEMSLWHGFDVVLSGNYYNVHPRGDASLRPAGEHVGWSTGGTTCARLIVNGGRHIRIGGPTPKERNLFGSSCAPMVITPRNPLSEVAVIGNYVGLDRTGEFSIAADSPFGMQTAGYGANVMDVRIGGVTPGSRNVLSGMTTGFGGQFMSSGANNRVVVQGNYFGLNAAGAAAVPNTHGAVFNTDAAHGGGPGELVAGGPEPGAGNVMSGNSGLGLYLWRFGGSWQITIQGNRIGTSADGLAAVPNDTGIGESGAAFGLTIGGANPGEGNVISGNARWGIDLPPAVAPNPPIRILGNFIGVGADGTTPLGNGRSGVLSRSLGGGTPHQAHIVGGIGAGEGNVIAYNRMNGVVVSYPNGYGAIRGNSMFANDGIGISLLSEGAVMPLANNTGDAPMSAGNAGRNYPLLMSASVSGSLISIDGWLDTLTSLGVDVDFYASDTADWLGYAEGQRYLGTHSFVTPLFPQPGGAWFLAQFATSGVDAGDFITATTTDQYGNTSEFSLPVVAKVVDRTAPVVTCPAPTAGSAGPSGMAKIPYVLPDVIASDDVTPSSSLGLSQSPAAGTTAGVGSHAITVTATDAAGNSASCTTTFEVVDTTPPSVACQAPTSVQADAAGSALIPNVLGGVSASDNVTPAGSILLAQTPSAGTVVGVGIHAITVTATDAAGNAASCTTSLEVTSPPPPPVTLNCSAAAPTVSEIWPPNHKFVDVGIVGVTNSGRDPIGIVITGILQDEPTNTNGDGNTAVDGAGVGTPVARVRAERSGTPKVPGNGRVYEIAFTAMSGSSSCGGVVFVGVPHDQGKGKPAADDGIRYDSTVAGGGRVR